jgi:hypothetical protein
MTNNAQRLTEQTHTLHIAQLGDQIPRSFNAGIKRLPGEDDVGNSLCSQPLLIAQLIHTSLSTCPLRLSHSLEPTDTLARRSPKSFSNKDLICVFSLAVNRYALHSLTQVPGLSLYCNRSTLLLYRSSSPKAHPYTLSHTTTRRAS